MKSVIYLDAQKPSSLFLTGSRVDEWVDANGSGKSIATSINGTAFNPTFDGSLFGGRGGVVFNGANRYLESPAAFTSLNWSRGFTVLCAGQYNGKFFAASDSSFPILGAGLGSRMGLGTAGQSSVGLPVAPCIFGVRWDRNVISFILNGKLFPVHEGAPMVGSGAFGKLQIGGLEPGGAIDMNMAGIQLFDGVIDDDDIAVLCAAMKAKYGFADLAAPLFNFVADGNSLGVGYWSNDKTTMWDGVRAISGATPESLVNVCNSAYSTPQLSARASAVVDRLLNLGVPSKRRVLMVWEISNDLSGTTQTATAAYANIRAYCQDRKAAGWKVIVCTCLPRTQPGINVNFETRRLVVNSSILANAEAEGWADAVADIGGDASLQDANDTTYFNDKTHLTSAGHDIAKNYISVAVSAVMA